MDKLNKGLVYAIGGVAVSLFSLAYLYNNSQKEKTDESSNPYLEQLRAKLDKQKLLKILKEIKN